MIGRPAPDFTLPAVHRDGEISLADYRGKSHLLLAVFIGLYCPFCRRNIAQLGAATEKLRGVGVETLGVVATELENARLYFKYRPARIAIAADPDLVTHRAFGLPRRNVTDELMQDYASLPVNPTGEAPEPIPMAKLGPLLDRSPGRLPAQRRGPARHRAPVAAAQGTVPHRPRRHRALGKHRAAHRRRRRGRQIPERRRVPRRRAHARLTMAATPGAAIQP